MLKMSSQLENIISAYKILSKIPSVAGGQLNNAATRVTAKWSVRNLDKGKPTKYVTSYTLDDGLRVIAESDFGTDVSNELLSAVSPSETYKAVIREEKNAKDVKKQYLEVWNKSTLAHSIDLTALDIHGDVYADSEFGCLDWSQDESALVYVAEKKLPKSEPFLKRKGEEKPKDGSGDAATKGEEFVYKQDWGEQLVGKHLSVIVLCKLQTETCTVLSGLPEHWCPGQVRFAPDGSSVVGVAWETEPRRLGLIFCTNRPSFIFNLTLDGNMKTLSGEGLAVRSPRFSSTGDLVWLQRCAQGPHHACHQLALMKHNESKVTIITDIVESKIKTATDDDFYGLYCLALPNKCFSDDGKRILLSTPQQTEVRSYVIDIDGGRIADISNRVLGSTSVLDVRRDTVLASCSSMTAPAQLLVGRLPSTKEWDIKWQPVSAPIQVPPSVASARVDYEFLTQQGNDDVRDFNAIYFGSDVKEKRGLPLIVWPHGGPHSSFVNAFSLEAALFNMLGFACLQVNFRGSTGTGQSSVKYLPKRVGDADVKDCVLATNFVLTKYPVDGHKLCLFGGSHGGFLVTHLSGQYPDMFQVVVSRNPVIDVATMYNSTDIADWCAVEAGYTFSERGAVSEEELLSMRRCSPIVHVHKVKAPTALMLGSGDKRVPHYQGLEYARRLKANGVTTRVFMYDDNHSLSSTPAEMDNLINSVNWFLDHLPDRP